MKILVTSHFPLSGCGSGSYVRDLVHHLPKSASDLALIGLVGDSALRTNAQVFRLSAHQIVRDGFPVFTFHDKGGRTFELLSDEEIASYFRLLCDGLDEAIHKFRPDTIHVNHFWLFAAAALRSGLPFVITVHGSELAYLLMPRWRECLSIACSSESMIIANSNFTAQKLVEALPSLRARIRVLPFGPSIKSVKKPTAGSKTSPAQPTVLYCGKLTAMKRVDTLIRAAEIYESQAEGIRTVICGDGPEAVRLRSMAIEENLEGVSFLGTLPAEGIRDLMRRASVYVSPCPEEGLGLAALEACSQGTPVIAAAGGAHLESITNDVGCLFRPSDHEALAEAVLEAVREDWKSKLGDNCCQLILMRFNLESHVSGLMHLYPPG